MIVFWTKPAMDLSELSWAMERTCFQYDDVYEKGDVIVYFNGKVVECPEHGKVAGYFAAIWGGIDEGYVYCTPFFPDPDLATASVDGYLQGRYGFSIEDLEPYVDPPPDYQPGDVYFCAKGQFLVLRNGTHKHIPYSEDHKRGIQAATKLSDLDPDKLILLDLNSDDKQLFLERHPQYLPTPAQRSHSGMSSLGEALG